MHRRFFSISRNSPQDTRALQSVFIYRKGMGADTLAWTISDIAVEMGDPRALLDGMRSAHVVVFHERSRMPSVYHLIDVTIARPSLWIAWWRSRQVTIHCSTSGSGCVSRSGGPPAPTRATGATCGAWIQRGDFERQPWSRAPLVVPVADKTRLLVDVSLSARRTLPSMRCTHEVRGARSSIADSRPCVHVS